MLTIQNYCLAESLEQAYEWNQKKNNKILGGGVWLKCCGFPIQTAIDLGGLGLEQMEETEDEFSMGCMVTLRQLETHPGLLACTGGSIKEAVRHIVGTQFRNCATLGGSLAGRFGFSDVLTLFLALHAEVEVYPSGRMPLEVYANMEPDGQILTNVYIKKNPGSAVYLSERNTETDLPLVTCALTVREDQLCVSIGARPSRAGLVTLQLPPKDSLKEETCKRELAKQAVSHFSFGSNRRASAEYRRHVAEVLICRGLKQLEEDVR